jgi:hypothetical protein
MGIKSVGASILTSDSTNSGSLVIVNKPAGYTVTGAALKSDTSLKKSIITPGSIEVISDIGGGGTAPTITSLTVTDASWVPTVSQYVDTVTGGYVEIVGTGFDAGAIAYLNGATLTTTRVDSTKLRIVIPPTAAGAYSIMVFNSDNVGAIFANINLSIAPSFVTSAGSLGSFYESSNVNTLVSATADSTLSYTLSSGELPSGVNVNTNGSITGSSPIVAANTNYSFVITATDVELQTASRNFSLSVIPDSVTWLTPEANLSLFGLLNIASDNVLVSANSLASLPITYSANTLPTGLSIVSGNITGTPTVLGTTSTRLTATSSSTKNANLTISYKVVEPYVLSNYASLVNDFAVLSNTAFAATATSIKFDTTGGNLFVLDDGTNNVVFQYSLSTNWNVKTKTLTSTFNFNEETSPQGLFIKSDGLKMYILGTAVDKVLEFNLATPWLVSSASKVGEFDISTREINSSGIYFNDTGNLMYVTGRAGDDVTVFSLSTNWQANTATFVGEFKPSVALPDLSDIAFNSTGTKMYLSCSTSDTVTEYSISPAWNILSSSNVGTYTYNVLSTNKALEIASVVGITLSSDDKRIYLSETGLNDTVIQFNLSTPGDLSTITPARWNFFQAASAGETTLSDFFIGNQGRKLYVTGATTDTVYEFGLPTAWDIGTAQLYGNTAALTAVEGTITGLYFKDDGSKMYITGTGSDSVSEYILSTNWSANTATYVGNLKVTDTSPQGLYFKSTGDKFYVVGSGSDKVYEYYMTTPWQVNTGVFFGEVLVSSQDNSPGGLTFSDDGKIMFMVGQANDTVYRYNLSTAWQANTASSNANLNLSSTQTSMTGIQFGRNGLYMFISGAEQVDTTASTSGITAFFVS